MILSQQSGDWDLHAGDGGSRSESEMCYSLASHMLLPVPGQVSLFLELLCFLWSLRKVLEHAACLIHLIEILLEVSQY